MNRLLSDLLFEFNHVGPENATQLVPLTTWFLQYVWWLVLSISAGFLGFFQIIILGLSMRGPSFKRFEHANLE